MRLLNTHKLLRALMMALFSSISAFASIQDKNLQFTYMSNDGDITLTCKHFRADQDSNYWKVKCSDEKSLLKEYKIYFNIRVAQNASSQTQAFEFLYFINDRNQKTPTFSSQGTWMHLKSLSELQALTLDLSLENDYSFLRVNFTAQDLKISDLEQISKRIK